MFHPTDHYSRPREVAQLCVHLEQCRECTPGISPVREVRDLVAISRCHIGGACSYGGLAASCRGAMLD